MTEFKNKNEEEYIVVKPNQLDIPFNELYGYGDNYITPREFILETEEEFNLPSKNLDQITEEELDDYTNYLDDLCHIKNNYLEVLAKERKEKTINTKATHKVFSSIAKLSKANTSPELEVFIEEIRANINLLLHEYEDNMYSSKRVK